MITDSYRKPVLIDNRNLRTRIPDITLFFKKVEEEANSFPKENGLIVDKEYVDFRPCPICASEKAEQLFIKWGFKYVQCPTCQHVYVKNALNEKTLLGLYETSPTDKIDRSARTTNLYQQYWQKMYDKYLSLFKELDIKNNRLFDIGAGSGLFLDYAKKHTTFELYGSEFAEDTKEFIESIVGADHFYYQQKLEDTDFGDLKFGFLTLWGVLEHVYHPKEVLAKCADILDPEGSIIALVPNFKSRAIQILGISTPTLNPRGHVQNFSIESMEYLCKNVGLKIADVFGELPVIDLMYDHLDYSDQLVDEIMEKKQSYYHVYRLQKV